MPRSSRLRVSPFAFTSLLLLNAAATLPGDGAEAPPRELVLILDASGSMWGQVGGEAKISIARRVLRDLAGKLPAESAVGLIAYGHRREGDCADVETVLPLAPVNRQALVVAVEALQPKGKTPITRAAAAAIELVRAAAARRSPTAAPTRGRRPTPVSSCYPTAPMTWRWRRSASGEPGRCASPGSRSPKGKRSPGRRTSARGELAVSVTRNGALSDAVVSIYRAGAEEQVAGGRTYRSASSNPAVYRLSAGTYDVQVGSVEIEGKPEQRFPAVVVATARL